MRVWIIRVFYTPEQLLVQLLELIDFFCVILPFGIMEVFMQKNYISAGSDKIPYFYEFGEFDL